MRPPRLLLACLFAGLLFGACSDPEPNIADPTPTPSPTVSTSAPTTSPSSASPTLEPLGPAETVRAWVKDWNAALSTGDISRLQAYNSSPCRNCDEILGLIGDVYAAGGSIQGGTWTPVTIKPIGERDGATIVALAVESEAGVTVPSAGGEPVEFAAEKSIVRFFVVVDNGSSRFSAIEFLS